MELTGKKDQNEYRKKSFIHTIILEGLLSLALVFLLGYFFNGGSGDLNISSFIEIYKKPDFDWEKMFISSILGLVTFAGLGYYSWMNYERLKNTMLGKEHGTSSLMRASDMPGFNQNFFYDPKIVGRVEGWAGDEKKEKKHTKFNGEQLKKVCKQNPSDKKVFDECFKHSQIMGQDVYLSMNCKFINRNLNSLTIGGSGQGKSYSELFPNALSANCNYIFTDPSGEILRKVGKFLKSQGYTLKVFNVDEFAKSMKYNPFVYIETEKDYNTVVDALNKNIKGGEKQSGGSNQFFDDAQYSLTCALIALLKELYPVRKITDEDRRTLSKEEINEIRRKNRENLDKQTLKNVMQLLLMAEQEVKRDEDGREEGTTSKLDELFDKLLEHDSRSYAAAMWKSFKIGGPKVCNEVIISACAVFSRFFQADDLEWLTSTDELKLYDLASEKKCALFLVTPQDTTTYNFLVAMVYTQIFGIVMKAGKNYCDLRGTDNPALPIHLSFWLDEFANIGKIPNFLELLAVVRKYNISINIIIQGMAQLKGLYPKDQWEVILANLDTMIYLGGMEPTTVKWLSEKMGKNTIKQISSNRNAKSAGESYSNIGRAVMTPDEIEQMPRAYEFVFISGCKPIMTRKYDLSKHPNYKYSGECDTKNNYNIFELVPPEKAKIDYDRLDDALVTIERIENFDFTTLEVKEGHKKGYVMPSKFKDMSIEDIAENLVRFINGIKDIRDEKHKALHTIVKRWLYNDSREGEYKNAESIDLGELDDKDILNYAGLYIRDQKDKKKLCNLFDHIEKESGLHSDSTKAAAHGHVEQKIDHRSTKDYERSLKEHGEIYRNFNQEPEFVIGRIQEYNDILSCKDYNPEVEKLEEDDVKAFLSHKSLPSDSKGADDPVVDAEDDGEEYFNPEPEPDFEDSPPDLPDDELNDIV